MSERARLLLFLTAAFGLSAFLAWGMAGLPPFGVYRGPYGIVLNAVVVQERHVTDMATAINFDYRGMDTLGEEFILFAAVAGGTLLLRRMREDAPQDRDKGQEKQGDPQGKSQTESKSPAESKSQEGGEGREANEPAHGRGQVAVRPTEPSQRNAPESEIVQWLGSVLAGFTVLFGIYIVIHAQQTPGGGFQGGAILGTACLLVYLTIEYRTFRQVAPEAAEAVGAGGYALIGLATLAAGGAFLQNVLPLGKTGNLLSGGTIWLINAAVGLEVATGFVLLFTEFLRQAEDENK